MMMKLKVCGMRSVENIAELIKLNPDFIGFIFHEKSPRNVVEFPLVSIPKNIKKTGVFVDKLLEFIQEKAQQFGLDYIQLHGNETPKYCDELKTKGFKLIKAFNINAAFDFEQTKAYEQYCDFFLFDAFGKQAGGNGITFNWNLLQNYKGNTPFLLSGGINNTMADELLAFKHKQYQGIDINSGFELAPALKNIEMIKEFKAKLNNNKMNYQVSKDGFYGEFGGAFIPEMLYHNVAELKDNYLEIINSEAFQKEFKDLLKHYVGRPTPLYYAKRLSEKYKTNIFLKREDLNHTGAHKINNTIGQILVAKHMGKKRIIAETGAGQHGVATATVCALMNLECIVYMGEVDIARQAPNVARMKMLGATVKPAVSGSKTLKDATNEAIRDWIANPEDTYYLIGSVVGPHPYPDMVARFQAVISKEMQSQLAEKTGRNYPDKIIACVGGGSNAAGAFYHYLDNEAVALIAVEADGLGVKTGKTAATTQVGTAGIIHGSKTLLMQNTEGQITEPYSISAGLDYPGVGPLHAHLFKSRRGTFLGATDTEALDAAFELTQLEGIIPALESAHALAALKKLTFKPDENVVVNLSGRGDKDMETYIKVLNTKQ